MTAERPLRHFGFACLLAVVGYAIAYSTIEHRRNSRGPWQIVFTNAPSGKPLLIVDQPKLGITNIQILFDGSGEQVTNSGVRITFKEPRSVPYSLPFGECVFMDTTFLPGTVAMELFGHEIELLPRVLVIDRKERSWLSGMMVDLANERALTNVNSMQRFPRK